MTKPINLITCFYKDPDFLRHAELDECLGRNIQNPLISRIFLLVEEGAENEPRLNDPKIERVVVPQGRPTFADLISVANKFCPGQLVVFANSDIYFDETLAALNSLDTSATVYISTRREVAQLGRSLWSYHQQASDAWIVSAPIEVEGLEIELGKNGCESLFLGRMFRAGYAIENISLDLKCYHMHASDKRAYDPKAIRYTEDGEMAFPLISGRAPSRGSEPHPPGPIVIDGTAFADVDPSAFFWKEVFAEWHSTPFGQNLVVLNRGGFDAYGVSLPFVDAPPLNSYLISGVRRINGVLARRLGGSVFLSTGDSIALGVPSVVVAHSAAPEITLANLERTEFPRGLSFQMADYVLCGGDDIKAVLEDHYHHVGPSRFHTLPLWHGGNRVFACMPAAERSFARRQLAIKERYVVFAGPRTNRDKTMNLKVLAQALRQLGNLGIVFISGGDTLEPEVLELFEGIPLKHIKEESPETVLTIAAAEAYILPNLGGAETDWSHVALAAGCPIVRSIWSPLHRDGGGTVFFTASSPHSLATTLERTMHYERDGLGVQAIQRVSMEIRVSNAKRLAVALHAIRARTPLPSIVNMLRDSGRLPDVLNSPLSPSESVAAGLI